jgi:glucokinase
MAKYYVGIDIGGTNVRAVICDEEKILIKVSSKTIKKGPPESLATQITHMIERGMKELDIKIDQIGGIGTSSAGPFVGGESLSTPNICGVDNDWTIIPYLQELRKHFGSDKKYEIANDCVSAVKAESMFGAGRNYKNCVYITISTGVGTGIIADGHLIEGKGKNAGHFGHIIVQKDGIKCGCGQYGCVETIISGKNIERRAKEAGLNKANSPNFSAKEVFDLYRENNAIAKTIIEETIQYLGILLINVINATDTELLIIGGSVFLNNQDILQPAVEEFIVEHSMVTLSEGVQIVPPELGFYVGDLAGLSLVMPSGWADKWVETKPWKTGLIKEIFISTEEAMK